MYIRHVECTPDMYDVRQACTIYVNHVRHFCVMYIQHVRCTPDMYNILALRTYNIHVTSQVKKSCLVLLFTCETYINIRITSNLFSPCVFSEKNLNFTPSIKSCFLSTLRSGAQKNPPPPFTPFPP